MSKIGLWSTTAGNNNSTPPDGWPEGQAPSTINDCGREMMAQIRAYASDAQYFDPGITPSYLSSTTFSLAAADTTSFHVGRRVKLFDASTLYGTIQSVSSTFVSVLLDSGALTASLSSVAVSVLGEQNNALPNTVWQRQNALINGSIDIWQRGNSFSPANNSTTYTASKFFWLQSASAAVNISRAERSAASTNVPDITDGGTFLTNSLKISVSAADAALAAGEYGILGTIIEGYDWRQIAHRPQVLSFMVNSNRSGIYCVSVRNSPASTSFIANYTLSAVNTWTRFSIAIPEAPTNVTWNYSQSAGAVVAFCFGAGSTYQGGAGNFTAGNLLATSSQVNFLGSAGNVFMITGLQLTVGNFAPPLQIRPYQQELELCERTYWRGYPGAQGLNFPAYTAGCVMSWPVSFPTTMRITPTMALAASGITMAGLAGTPSVSLVTPDGFKLICSASVATVNCSFTFGANDYIEADADFY